MTLIDPQAAREHWDSLAPTYDDAKQRNAAYYATLKECFSRAVPVECRQRVLDIGTGTGQVLADLKPADGVGIDASPHMIEIARRNHTGRANLTFRVMDLMETSHPGSFSAVISSDVLEHVDDWRSLVNAMLQACRPGGRLVISTPNPKWAVPLWVLERLNLKMPEGPHRFVAGRDVAAHLNTMGCTNIRLSTHALLPARLFGLGPRISSLAERAPIVRGLGVIQMIVADTPAGQHL